MTDKSIIDFLTRHYYKIEVKLTYFKKSGKYYTKGSYMSDYKLIYHICEDIRNMEKHPGLSGKWEEGFISVDIPEHCLNHPHLIVLD